MISLRADFDKEITDKKIEYVVLSSQPDGLTTSLDLLVNSGNKAATVIQNSSNLSVHNLSVHNLSVESELPILGRKAERLVHLPH